MFYARYGKLAGILAFDNGQKRFKAIGATRTFDEYVLGGPLPAMRDRPSSTLHKGEETGVLDLQTEITRSQKDTRTA